MDKLSAEKYARKADYMNKNIYMAATVAFAVSVMTGCTFFEKPATVEEPTMTVAYNTVLPPLDLQPGIEVVETTTTEPPTTTTEAPTTTTEPPTTEPPTTEPPTTAPPSDIDLIMNLPVKYNDYSYDVAVLQHRLIELGYLESGTADGRFGPQTYNAVKAFQAANMLEETGTIEEPDFRVLCSVNAVTSWDAEITAAVWGDSEEITDVSGHVHTSQDVDGDRNYIQYYSQKSVEPTCTTEGYTLHTCSICGGSYRDNITPPKGHSFVMAVKGGVVTRTCTVCGYTYTESED